MKPGVDDIYACTYYVDGTFSIMYILPCDQVKLKEYGSELIEVADDGSGVSKVDLEGLALKHHTSKLNRITDLQV